MRVTTAFKRLLRLPGASVSDVEFGAEGVIVTVRLRRRRRVSVLDDATMELLRLAVETGAEGLVELLSDMRIAGLGVSRWELMSAPRRIELVPELEARLVPLRRG